MFKMQRIINWALTKSVTARMQAAILIGLLSVQLNSAVSPYGDLPCDFFDSLNITDGARQTNESILFNGLEFPAGQYVNLNYTLKYDIEHVTVTPYIRGCICNRMSCIRLCCPFGSIQINSDECQPNEAARNVRVFSENYQNKQMTDVEQDNYFAFVDSYPCKQPDAVADATQYMITPVRELIELSSL